MKRSDILVSLVAVVEDPLDELKPVLASLERVLASHFESYEVILVNDDMTLAGSAALRAAIAGLRNFRALTLTRQCGKEICLAAGLDSAIGDCVVTLDLGSDPLEMIPALVDRSQISSGIVIGVTKEQAGVSLLRKLGGDLFRWYARRVLGCELRQGATDFQALNRRAVNVLTRIRQRARSHRWMAASIGFEVEWVPYERKFLTSRRPAKTLLTGWNSAINITVAASRHPLRFVAYLGLAASALNLFYIGYVVLIYLFKAHVAEGWTTQSLQTAGMFFLLFLVLAVLCEYVGRLMEESQPSPLYFLAEEIRGSAEEADQDRRNVVISNE